MSIGGIGTRSSLATQSLVDMRRQLDDLQRQLATGKKSTTYAGLGMDRNLALGLRSQLSAIQGYDEAATYVGLRLDLTQTALTRLNDIGRNMKAAVQQSSVEFLPSGQTAAQERARVEFDAVIDLLNTRAGDRFLFSGRATDQPATASAQQMMNGDGLRAGLTTVIDERRQADVGTGTGRLLIPAAVTTTLSVSEDAAGSPFGLKLASVSHNLSGATVTGPSGSPPAIAIDLGATGPNAGDSIAIALDLPDGSRHTVQLQAATATIPGAGRFTIGATVDATAANLQAAVLASVQQLVQTPLVAASALAAGKDFFASDPPQRVDLTPPATLATATALRAGTAADTVSWYTGESGSDPARSTSTARVDPAVTVSYGMRANEEALSALVQNIGVLAAVKYPSGDPDPAGRYAALKERTATALGEPPGRQRVGDIAVEMVNAQSTLGAAKTRHIQTGGIMTALLEEIESARPEEMGAQILALNTRLQASLQTTAMMYRMSLVQYL